MGKLYFLSKYISTDLGGGMIRQKQIDFFIKQGIEVFVVLPNWETSDVVMKDGLFLIPFKKNIKLQLLKQHIGIIEDFLDPWVEEAYKYILPLLKPEDIIFASPSGDLSCLKLASKLKKAVGMKYIANLHDPLNYSIVNGRKFGAKPHASREKSERSYLENTDLVITSSMTYCNALKNKYPEFSDRIINSYFGFVNKENLISKKYGSKLRIAYGGTYYRTQKPEILAYTASKLDNVKIYYIGKHYFYKPLMRYKEQCVFVNSMQNKDYNRFLLNNVDVGFVSLCEDWFGACVPSKIYEYINLGLPILGALPDGDAKDIINKYGYGIAVHFNDYLGLKKAIKILLDRDRYLLFKDKIIQDRDLWSMERHVNEIASYLCDNIKSTE